MHTSISQASRSVWVTSKRSARSMSEFDHNYPPTIPMKLKSSPLSFTVGTLCAAATLFAATSRAQSGGQFDLSWSTIDAGGGTSSGGQFALSGTIGQPDAGVHSGGNFTLAGGFWSGITLQQTPGTPLLKIKLIGN